MHRLWRACLPLEWIPYLRYLRGDLRHQPLLIPGRFRVELECTGRGGSLALTREISMKKQTKKLVLAKETVGSLQDGALGKVAGGESVSTCDFFSCIRYCLDEPIGPPGPSA